MADDFIKSTLQANIISFSEKFINQNLKKYVGSNNKRLGFIPFSLTFKNYESDK